jgi:hypothetical protein
MFDTTALLVEAAPDMALGVERATVEWRNVEFEFSLPS